jgi:predicted metal-dependent enzyme (double-stranded beta helix superfamily)
MAIALGEGVSELVSLLDGAVALGTQEARAGAVKQLLADTIRSGALALDERFFVPKPDAYARRLLHRDTTRGYSAVVMTWGPGQGTQLHDHAGIWCVEGTIAGEMEVLQYEISERADPDRFRFAPRGRVRALPGASGALIPPFEYHVLRNALADRVSVTLHIYGGEMDHCNVFLPEESGWHRRASRPLAYDA